MAGGACRKCGTRHFLGNPCPEVEIEVEEKAQPSPPILRRNPAPEGFAYSSGWGVNTRGVPVTWTLPKRVRMGTLVFPEETT